MSTNTRKEAVKSNSLGIPFTYNDPPYWVTDRFRSRLLFKNPRTGKTERITVITGSTTETVLAKVHSTAESFPREEVDLVTQWIRQGDYDPTVVEYYEIREDLVKAQLSRWYRLNRFTEIWNMIRPAFTCVHLSSLTENTSSAKDVIRRAVDSVFRRAASKRPMSELERLAWIMVKAILAVMVDDEILEANTPLSELVKNNIARPETTDISRAFNVRSFSLLQAARYLSLVHELDENDLKCALLVHYLLGPNYYELCALDIDSYHPAQEDSPAFLTIVREYYEKRGCPPEMREPDSYNQYRNLPCSAVLEEILNIQVKRRMKQGARSDDHLFLYNGSRLKPSEIKKCESKFLSHVFKGYPLERARTDFIRSNARWHFLNVCSMLPTEEAYMAGTDRIATYAVTYVDWRSPMILSALAGKLDRWHYTDPLTPDSRARPDNVSSLRTLSGTVFGQARIHIKNRHGFQLSLYCSKMLHRSGDNNGEFTPPQIAAAVNSSDSGAANDLPVDAIPQVDEESKKENTSKEDSL